MFNKFHRGLTATGKVFNIDIQPLTRKWSDIYLQRRKLRGKKDAVKFMKELNTVAERYALYQPIEPIPWTKSNKDGFPLILNPFKRALRSKDSKRVILALSVMRTVELLRLPISKDISTVTDPPYGVSETTLESVINFIPEFLSSLNRPLKMPDMKYHPTTKNGPNGPALWASDLDIQSVMKSPELYRAIRIVEEKLNDKYPMEEVECSSQDFIHSKLTQFPEKSGKTRTIAVIDYYSQRCLKPLHEGLMDILESMVSDGTSSHLNVGKFAAQKTKEKSFIYCADLSAATDRFPKQIQRALLFELVKDGDLASSFWTLLAERQFKVAWSEQIVTYQCGQPMGAYASWPLFALAHHLVIEYCAKLAQCPITKAKNLYRVIGDDVIIAEEAIAQYYQDIMSSLGMTINQGKTVLSLPSQPHSCAEVAKQLYLNGICLTPLTPGFVKDLRKPHMFGTCVAVLRDRYEFIRPEVPPMLIEALYPKGKLRQQVWLQCSDPIDSCIKPGEPGYDTFSPWDGIDPNLVLDLYRDFRIEAFMNAAISYMGDIGRQYGKSGDPWVGTTRTQPSAVIRVTSDMKKRLDDATQKFQFNSGPDADVILAEFAYIPDPIQPFRSRRELKLQRQSRLKVDIYKQIKMWE